MTPEQYQQRKSDSPEEPEVPPSRLGEATGLRIPDPKSPIEPGDPQETLDIPKEPSEQQENMAPIGQEKHLVPSGGPGFSGAEKALLGSRGVFQAADGRWVRAVAMPNGGEGSMRLVPVDPQALLGRIPERARGTSSPIMVPLS